MVAEVKVEQMTPQELLLFKVAMKFQALLKASADPVEEIARAADQLMSAGLLWSPPEGSATPNQAASQMIADNDLLMEDWLRIAGTPWEAATTPHELVLELIPSLETRG